MNTPINIEASERYVVDGIVYEARWPIRSTQAIPKLKKWSISKSGLIYLTVISTGRTPKQWINYFENEKKDENGRSFDVSRCAADALMNTIEAPTNGIAYRVVICPGYNIEPRHRFIETIQECASLKKWKTPHWEVSCLVRDYLTDYNLRKLSLCSVLAMHEPIKVCPEDTSGSMLEVSCGGAGRCLLSTGYGKDLILAESQGFGFVVSQKSVSIGSRS